MPNVVTDSNPITLADFEGLTSDKPVRQLIHTIRDYNGFFDQAVIQRGNDGFGDRGKVVTSYPEGQVRAFNEGWDAERVTGADVRYAAAMVRSRSEVDKSLLDTRKANERAAFRLRTDEGFMRGLSRSVLKKVLYGDSNLETRDPNGIFNIVSPTNKAFADRIIDAKGTTANAQTDILLINWDPASTYLFYPENGSNAGLSVENMGEQYAFDAKGKRFRAEITEFAWDIGVAMYDPQRVVRIANIDSTKLTKKNTTGPDLLDLMIDALERLPDEQQGRVAFYMNDNTRSFLARQILNKDNVLLSQDEVAGRKCMTFRGVPIHRLGTDILSNKGAVLTL